MILKFTNRAKKDLSKLPPKVKVQVREAICSLAGDHQQGIKLSGSWGLLSLAQRELSDHLSHLRRRTHCSLRAP